MASLLLIVALLCPFSRAGSNFTDDLTWVRGVDYVPSWAHNDMGIWLDYEEAVVERELGFAAEAGINALRIFLHWLPWQHDPTLFMQRIEHFLATAEKNTQRVLFVVLDSCFGNVDAQASWIADRRYVNMSWIPNPGPAMVADASTWGAVDAYVKQLVGTHADDKRVLGWDVMNEPAFNTKGIDAFLEHFIRLVNSIDKTHFTTVGVASSNEVKNQQDLVTVISYHNYHGSDGGKALAADIAGIQALGKQLGKPTMVTETMNRYWDKGTNHGQRLCSDVIPAVTAQKTGFFLWEMMLGVDQFNHNWQHPYQGMIYPTNGSWWSEDEHQCLKTMTPKPTPPPPPTPPTPAPPVPGCSGAGCEFVADTDYQRLRYSPESVWTAWQGQGPPRSTLHYCKTKGCAVHFALGDLLRRADSSVTSVTLVHKTGTDCGVLDVLLDGAPLATGVDTYSEEAEWAHTLSFMLPSAGAGSNITVVNTGEKNAASADTFVQVVGFEVRRAD